MTGQGSASAVCQLLMMVSSAWLSLWECMELVHAHVEMFMKNSMVTPIQNTKDLGIFVDRLHIVMFMSWMTFPYCNVLPVHPVHRSITERLQVYKTEINGHGGPLRWPRDTLYPQKLSLTSPTSGGRSVGIVFLRTKATEFTFYQSTDIMVTLQWLSFLKYLNYSFICILGICHSKLAFGFSLIGYDTIVL
jgi:hypothetical protein